MFAVDNQSRIPVYEQVVAQAERFVLTGLLQPDVAMPSVRSLAISLSANPNTIQKAYAELERRGITYSAPGKGSFITSDAREKISERRRDELGRITILAHECAMAGIEKSLALDAVEKGYDMKREEVS